LRGHIARVVLLFYLTPVWSAIGGRIFLGIPITRRRMLTIALGLAGMAVIFSADAGLPLPRNIAEWMALISGILWAGGLVILHRIESVPVFDKTFVQFLFLGSIYLCLSFIPGAGSWSVPTPDNAGPALLWISILAVFWVLPVLLLTMYAAGKIDPAKVSILLTLEVAVGVTTTALLTNEPFGLGEGVGAVLIIAAGLMEFSFVPKSMRTRPLTPGQM
jgi:drug/metabolite transporter (DMT)-like permease